MAATIDFGIDLGTTNSSVALCREGRARVFQSNDLMTVTPSVVYVGRGGRMLVGKRAYDAWVQDPQNTQAEFKRWIGMSDRMTFPASGRSMSAEELSAEVLKSVRADAVRQTQEDVTAAVITVPAAFGSLQCEATGRAAKLAGFEEAPLLQEPIAAAIAYGVGPGARNQRWMVFDLGGGTLDIAIVSTRNDRLAVLDHQGDNRLGGKDVDRMIAESLLFAPLAQAFHLPDRQTDAPLYEKLLRGLIRQAEQAKMALSTAESVEVELFDLGNDRDGKPIELTLSLTRQDVEGQITSLVERCLALAHRALAGARLAPSDLNRVLLVGGPTQMPILRSALSGELGVKLDHSLDPMTVVAQGAAFYASTIQRRVVSSDAPTADKPAATRGTAMVELSYERASGTVQSPVAGVFKSAAGIHEVKVDADGGFWSSGWIPASGGRFMTEVRLDDKRSSTSFTLSARDRKGRGIPVEPHEFAIAFMLPMAAPPLPHTIAVELTDHQGRSSYDPIFKRHGPLPAEVCRTFKAERTLRPSEPQSTLPIKFWEIDVSDDPAERWWAGCVHVRADQIKRPIVEGSDLELTIRIDASRKMTVDVFVPALNQFFEDGVYIPEQTSARSQLQAQIDLCFHRLEIVRERAYEADRDDLIARIQGLQERLETIVEQAAEQGRGASADPDAMLAPTETLRKIRLQLAQIEEQVGGGDFELIRKVRADARWTQRVVGDEGDDREKEELSTLLAQLEKYVCADDPRGLKWVQQRLLSLRLPILDRLQSFWDRVLSDLQKPWIRFVNDAEARALLQEAERAQAAGNLPAMRDALNKAWNLQPPDKAHSAKDQLSQSGLRGT